MNPTSKKFKAISSGQTNSVVVDNDLSYALKVWKRLLKDTNVMQECYDRKFYRKPSEIRRLRSNLAKYTQHKEDLKNAN
jgi:ribosomal protein S21